MRIIKIVIILIISALFYIVSNQYVVLPVHGIQKSSGNELKAEKYKSDDSLRIALYLFQNLSIKMDYCFKSFHVSTIEANKKYIEYSRSCGLLIIQNPQQNAHFDSITNNNPWKMPKVVYVPIDVQKSFKLDYKGNVLKKYAEDDDINNLYNAYGYPFVINDLINAIYGFGPQKIEQSEYFDYILDKSKSNATQICFSYSARKNIPCELNPFLGYGAIWINRKNFTISKITGNEINIQSIRHGVRRNFGKKPGFNLSFSMDFEVTQNEIHIKYIQLNRVWNRDDGMNENPVRFAAAKNKLIEHEELILTKIYKGDKNASDLGFKINYPIPTLIRYNKNFWAANTVLLPSNNVQIYKDLSTNVTIEKQFGSDIMQNLFNKHIKDDSNKFTKSKIIEIYNSLN